ncbi:DNA glycosylase/AP lyase ROS1-like [Brassica napus]|uniref:DNA glycosylase/AP lyase ROS1-like n=1 Tax=Brassica napus TaxID=3708 RepID=UPI0006AAB63D|nr:DNA glycosylase/AP lyase ROS1-like [Brassica napus]
MDKQAREETTWVPQTPIKPIAPIYPDKIQTEERRFAGNKDKSGLDHLSFGDLLALANNASSVFLSRQSGIDKESVIKTPEKPKRKKHRPKVVREAKPKRDIKPKTPKKPAAAVEGEESKTPKRKYVRKKKEANEDQEEYTPVEESSGAAAEDGEASDHDGKKPCRRALEFDDQSLKPQNGEAQHRDETKQDQDLQESHMAAVPSTPKRKRSSQSRRMGKEMKNNEAQATKRRQGKEPTRSNIYFSGQQYEQVFADNEAQWLFSTEWLQKGMRSRSTTGQQLVTQENVAAFDSDCRVLTFQGRQSFESNAHLDKIETPTKKRTTGHARFRCLSSTNKASEQSQVGWYSRQTQVASSRKKRTTKSQTKQLTLLPNHCHFPPSFAAGLAPEAIWQQRHSIEAISELMRLLDINREYSETALVPYGMNSSYSVGNQIVIFNGGAGAIVPSTRVKKPRRERAKVHIDNETDRVWKLLMESIDSEGVDGSDEKKAKWWEEERNVFRGRADSFIARMHLVQGDRRFTPWKGSVVDSVVGVFLTQNVSDHLSSSAFMSLAAEYPVPFVPSSDFEVGESSMPSIRITYLDSDEPISNPPVPSEVSAALNITQPDEEKEYVNSNDTSRSSSEIASSGNESTVKTTDSKAQVDSDRTGSSVEVSKTVLIVQELFPSEDSVLTCQNSLVSETPKKTERAGSSSEINSEAENCTHFVKLLESQGSAQLQEKESDVITADTVLVEEANQKTQCSSSPGSLQVSSNTSPGDCSSEVKDFESLKGKAKYSDDAPCCFFGDVLSVQKPEIPESSSSVPSTKLVIETPIPDINESTNCLDVQEGTEKQQPGPDSSSKKISPMDKATFNADGKKILKEVEEEFDWDSLRREAEGREGKREKTARSLDSVDWEAIRTADVNEVAETIKSRGMNHKLAERIQGFLNRLLTDHGSLDLEWLRDVPPDKAKEYLLSFNGLGLKSVECVRLLTLHHLAFPVDTNVGRIAVRLGWVPLQPLPESLQLHLLEMYPVLESIQKYLWPRLCKFDQKTLYELHYQMITFGKVFCTKSKPNCNACPMRGECRHFASAFASARFALPGPEKGMERPDVPLQSLPEPLRRQQGLEVVNHSEAANRVTSCEPIIEVPASPEPECAEVSMADIEDAFFEDPEEIPTIRLNMDAFTNNLKKIFEHSKELQDGNMSGALVALTAEAASLPMPKLKNISQLRTEHQVYELKDDHPLLAQFEKRETDDPCSYLLAIWTPGETVDSIQPTRSKCIWQEAGKMCNEKTCFSCNNIRETQSQTVRGTILVPCRTAMRGSFPLNGTYFQVNEVFADHESSLTPIDVPRDWLWDLARRTVYFGTSIPSIFKGLSTETIQQCFWRGYVCVRGFDRQTRAPRPLIARLHFPKSKMKSQVNPDDA